MNDNHNEEWVFNESYLLYQVNALLESFSSGCLTEKKNTVPSVILVPDGVLCGAFAVVFFSKQFKYAHYCAK